MKARNARIDTLRVVAMLMIICGHFIYHGMRHVGLQESTGVPFADNAVGRMNFVMAQFLGYACNIATNIYFMITGYFLVKPRTLSYAVSKSWKLWRTIVFYTLSVYVVLCATGAMDFSVPQMIEQLMPIHSRKYWFMSNYIVVLLLSPFVSKALDALAKKEYQGLLLVLLLLNFAEGSWGVWRHLQRWYVRGVLPLALCVGRLSEEVSSARVPLRPCSLSRGLSFDMSVLYA